jgi:hypothetical protein
MWTSLISVQRNFKESYHFRPSYTPPIGLSSTRATERGQGFVKRWCDVKQSLRALVVLLCKVALPKDLQSEKKTTILVFENGFNPKGQ